MPQADHTCATWRTTYRQGGEVKGVKDYQLCRGDGADDFFVDEGGVKLAARWIGDALVSPFKAGSLLLVSTVRLRGDVPEERLRPETTMWLARTKDPGKPLLTPPLQ